MNLVSVFQEFQRIMGICPCCGDVFRLSDAKVYSAKRPPQTPFDHVDVERAALQDAEVRFNEKERTIREKAAQKGRLEAKQRLRSLAGHFTRHTIDPHDVYALFDPLHYVAFDGLSEGALSRIAFVDESGPKRERLHESINKAIDAGNIEWFTLRIDAEGHVRKE